MKNVINVIVLMTVTLFSSLSTSVSAEENAYTQGYISDDLFIYMHAGPGTNYRILGTIIAGTEIKVTGNKENEYSEIIDDKNRPTWVESKYITTQAGLRFVVQDLNREISKTNGFTSELDGEVNDLKSQLNAVNNEKEQLSAELKKITLALKETQSKVKDQDTNIKKQWFFNGAIVLGLGLLLGLILPKFFGRRRDSMESWS